MTTCAVPGCVVRGKHIPDPTSAHPETCKGCLPRPALDGLAVCRWHTNRFEDAVASLPGLIAHLHEIGKPYAQTNPPGDTIGRSDPAWQTVLPAEWLTADELEADLFGWVKATLEESPRRLSWPDRRPWRGDLAAWMLDHQRDALAMPFAGEMVTVIPEAVATARHRWPTADDVEPVEALSMTCPRCGLRSLTKTPPRWYRQSARIECTDPDCARVFTEDEYDGLVSIALRDGRMGKWQTEVPA